MTVKPMTGQAVCKIVRGGHAWEKENFRSEDGGIYGIPGGYSEVYLDDQHIGDVSNGEYKATEQARRSRSNQKWWVALKDGKPVGEFVKTKKAAVEILVAEAQVAKEESEEAAEEMVQGLTEAHATTIIRALEKEIAGLERRLNNPTPMNTAKVKARQRVLIKEATEALAAVKAVMK